VPGPLRHHQGRGLGAHNDPGVALQAIHERFSEAYGPAAGNDGWYAMDVEFKFDDDASPGKPAKLYIKQARPYPDPNP